VLAGSPSVHFLSCHVDLAGLDYGPGKVRGDDWRCRLCCTSMKHFRLKISHVCLLCALLLGLASCGLFGNDL